MGAQAPFFLMNYYINNLKNKVEIADGIKRLIEDIAPTKWEMDEIQKAWDEVHEKHEVEISEYKTRIRYLEGILDKADVPYTVPKK
tara:strand:+ start:256 stop:513 length:258 start_codon:yes stop_codon:yes gene_type:complete